MEAGLAVRVLAYQEVGGGQLMLTLVVSLAAASGLINLILVDRLNDMSLNNDWRWSC